MGTLLGDIPEASAKRDAFIQIGKHRHRIASDHHRMLCDLQKDFGYIPMANLLFLTSRIGAMVLRLFNPLTLISVRSREERGKRL